MRYREGGLEAAVYQGSRPGNQAALDDKQKQRAVALACGPPPPGQAPWMVRVSAAEAIKRKIVPGIGREAIGIALQDHDPKPWQGKNVVRGRRG